MKNILKNIESILRFVRYRTVYPFVEMTIKNILDNKSFRRYLSGTNRFADFTNRVMNLTNDGRLQIKNLEVDIVKGCNLKCKYCTHVSPLRKGYIPLEQLSEWFETWSKKLAPENFFILGGEPLLHPEVEKVILTARKFWKDSKIVFVTNGIILPKKSDSVFDALRAVNATIEMSKHFDDPEYNQKLKEAVDCLSKSDIPFQIRDSYKTWIVTYKIDKTEKGQDKPLPFNSNFNTAWENCCAKNCVTLFDNHLYGCANIAAFQNAYKENVLSEEWKVVANYKSLPPESSVYDVFCYLNSGAFPECCVCPEQTNLVQPEQFQRKAA
jgi:hypothetical protein